MKLRAAIRRTHRSGFVFAPFVAIAACASTVVPRYDGRDAAPDVQFADVSVTPPADAGRSIHCGDPIVPWTLPLSQCGGDCLASWRAGPSATVLYDDSMHPDRRVHYMVTVTDAFAFVVTQGTGVGAPSALLAVPIAGGEARLVDAFDGMANPTITISTTDGPSVLYYALEGGAPGPRTFSLRRWDPSSGGLVLAPLRSRVRSMAISHGGPLFFADETGVARVDATGGSITRISDASEASRMAVSSRFLAWIEAGALLRAVPLPDAVAPRTLLSVPADRNFLVDLAFTPDADSLIVARPSGLTRVALDGRAPEVVYTAPIEVSMLNPIRIEGMHVYFDDACAPRVPDGYAPVLTRELDLTTRESHWLSEEPGYPFVPHVIVESLPYANPSAPAWSIATGFVNVPRGQ